MCVHAAAAARGKRTFARQNHIGGREVRYQVRECPLSTALAALSGLHRDEVSPE
jgi:hypothetical protein